MTLDNLIIHHDFDELVPCFLTIDSESAQSRLGDLQQSFNVLCEMIPGDAEGKAIVVSTQITTDKNNNEISCCLYASGCEDDSWDVCLAKEVIFGTAVGELRALAQILWQMLNTYNC